MRNASKEPIGGRQPHDDAPGKATLNCVPTLKRMNAVSAELRNFQQRFLLLFTEKNRILRDIHAEINDADFSETVSELLSKSQ